MTVNFSVTSPKSKEICSVSTIFSGLPSRIAGLRSTGVVAPVVHKFSFIFGHAHPGVLRVLLPLMPSSVALLGVTRFCTAPKRNKVFLFSYYLLVCRSISWFESSELSFKRSGHCSPYCYIKKPLVLNNLNLMLVLRCLCLQILDEGESTALNAWHRLRFVDSTTIYAISATI